MESSAQSMGLHSTLQITTRATLTRRAAADRSTSSRVQFKIIFSDLDSSRVACSVASTSDRGAETCAQDSDSLIVRRKTFAIRNKLLTSGSFTFI
jgi:hypothetical protein